MASRRHSPPASGTDRSVRRLARPLERKLLKKPDDVVECLEKTLPCIPRINLELSQSKKNKTPYDFDALMKEVNDLRDKHGTSKKEDCRADILSRVPASLLRDMNADGTTNPPGPNWTVFMDTNNSLASKGKSESRAFFLPPHSTSRGLAALLLCRFLPPALVLGLLLGLGLAFLLAPLLPGTTPLLILILLLALLFR